MQANIQEIGFNRNESTSSESCASRKGSVVAVDRFGRDYFTRLVLVLETRRQRLRFCPHADMLADSTGSTRPTKANPWFSMINTAVQ